MPGGGFHGVVNEAGGFHAEVLGQEDSHNYKQLAAMDDTKMS